MFKTISATLEKKCWHVFNVDPHANQALRKRKVHTRGKTYVQRRPRKVDACSSVSHEPKRVGFQTAPSTSLCSTFSLRCPAVKNMFEGTFWLRGRVDFRFAECPSRPLRITDYRSTSLRSRFPLGLCTTMELSPVRFEPVPGLYLESHHHWSV